MYDIESSNTLADTSNTDPIPRTFEPEAAAEPYPMDSDVHPHEAPGDVKTPGPNAEPAERSQPEPEQDEADQSVAQRPRLTRADAPVETAANAEIQPGQAGQPSEKDPMLAGKKSNADLAIELMKRRMTFFHTRDKEPYALFWNKDHMEVLPTRGEEFELCFGHLYYRYTQSAIKKSALNAVKQEAKAIALYDGREVDVGIRVAKFENTIYVDLGNSKWQQVEITTDGWRIIELKDSPVRF